MLSTNSHQRSRPNSRFIKTYVFPAAEINVYGCKEHKVSELVEELSWWAHFPLWYEVEWVPSSLPTWYRYLCCFFPQQVTHLLLSGSFQTHLMSVFPPLVAVWEGRGIFTAGMGERAHVCSKQCALLVSTRAQAGSACATVLGVPTIPVTYRSHIRGICITYGKEYVPASKTEHVCSDRRAHPLSQGGQNG